MKIKVMNVIDIINKKFGYGKLRLSSDVLVHFLIKKKKK